MLHIFVEPSEMNGDKLTITGTNVNHIRNVLRMKVGDELSVSNGQDEKEYRYGIEEIQEDRIECCLRFVKESDVELPVKVVLFQGLPKGDKMEWIVQKCTELGVYSVVPVEMERCVMKLDPQRKKKKTQRWQTIAESAAEQSRRRIIPEVHEPISMKEAVQMAGKMDVKILPYEREENGPDTRQIFESVRPGSTVAVFIGPEGGFAPEEVELARKEGILPVTLGRRILRTETAGMTVLSWFIYTQEI